MSFDDDTLLPNGGLAVAELLLQKIGVADLVDEHVEVGNAASDWFSRWRGVGAFGPSMPSSALYAGRHLHKERGDR